MDVCRVFHKLAILVVLAIHIDSKGSFGNHVHREIPAYSKIEYISFLYKTEEISWYPLQVYNLNGSS